MRNIIPKSVTLSTIPKKDVKVFMSRRKSILLWRNLNWKKSKLCLRSTSKWYSDYCLTTFHQRRFLAGTRESCYAFWPFKLWKFNFLRELAPGLLDGFSIGRYEKKRESFDLFAAKFENGAMRFSFPCPSIKRKSLTANSKSFKIAQTTTSEQKVGKVTLWYMHSFSDIHVPLQMKQIVNTVHLP